MDIERSRKFYQERYNKAIEQYGESSLTAKICKKKLEFLDAIARQHEKAENTSRDNHHTKDEEGTRPDRKTDEHT